MNLTLAKIIANMPADCTVVDDARWHKASSYDCIIAFGRANAKIYVLKSRRRSEVCVVDIFLSGIWHDTKYLEDFLTSKWMKPNG